MHMTLDIGDVDPRALREIMQILGLKSEEIQVSGRVNGSPLALKPPPETADPVTPGWSAETARMFVDSLTARALKVLAVICEGGGNASVDDLITELGLTNGKALGGIKSSMGHSIRALVDLGRLPADTKVIERNDETRTFHTVVPARVLRMLTSQVNRRQRLEAGRIPAGVARVA